MLCKVFVSAAVLSILCAAPMMGGPVDPLGPDFPDVGTDNLYLLAPNPICFDVSGHDDCLEGVTLTTSGSVSDNYSGGNELDTFAGQLSGDLVDTTASQDLGDWIIPYDGGGTGLELENRSLNADGTYTSDFADFDFAGTLPGLGPVEINQDGTPLQTGSTMITGPISGNYSITSFFDIFTEISVNDGPFIPSNQTSSEFDLAQSPEPDGSALGLIGVISLIVIARRSRTARISEIRRG